VFIYLFVLADNIKVTFQQILNIKAGDKYTMSDVGVLYYNKKQYKKAMQWYTLAVDDDMPVVACNIGQLFQLGMGVPVDYLRALKWYLKAARLADKYVYYNIASLFENGLGVPVDREKAVEWYLKYDEDADFITRYMHEGNEISSKQKGKRQ
jgi:TPR repeat protein